jgi:hypothetical protein
MSVTSHLANLLRGGRRRKQAPVRKPMRPPRWRWKRWSLANCHRP